MHTTPRAWSRSVQRLGRRRGKGKAMLLGVGWGGAGELGPGEGGSVFTANLLY